MMQNYSFSNEIKLHTDDFGKQFAFMCDKGNHIHIEIDVIIFFRLVLFVFTLLLGYN